MQSVSGVPLCGKHYFPGTIQAREYDACLLLVQPPRRETKGCTAAVSIMWSFFVAMLLVMSIPAVCWSFVAHGQHKLAGKTRVGKHEGRRSRTSTTTRAHPAAGFVAARGNSRAAAATRRSAKPSRYDRMGKKQIANKETDSSVLVL